MKEVSNLTVKIKDTEAPGTPDCVKYSYTIVDSTDNKLSYNGKGILTFEEGKSLETDTRTTAELYNDVLDIVKVEEGIK